MSRMWILPTERGGEMVIKVPLGLKKTFLFVSNYRASTNILMHAKIQPTKKQIHSNIYVYLPKLMQLRFIQYGDPIRRSFFSADHKFYFCHYI